jgi:hypothetical protein
VLDAGVRQELGELGAHRLEDRAEAPGDSDSGANLTRSPLIGM